MLLINNDQVKELLSIDQCIDAIEEGLKEYYCGDATCRPRIDVWAPCGQAEGYYQWGTMEGTNRRYSVFAIRMKSDIAYWVKGGEGGWTQEKYCQAPGKFCGLIMLFSLGNAEPLAMINDGYLQHMRVGATAGLGAKYLARKDAAQVGMIGSGGMARTHALAFAAVRPIKRIKVYSPNEIHREDYAREMSAVLGIETIPVERARQAAQGSEIVSCCTDSVVPVIKGEWLEEGSFLTTVKGGVEIDARTLERVNLFMTFSPNVATSRTHIEAENPAQRISGRHKAYVAGRPEDISRIPKVERVKPVDSSKVFSFRDLLAGTAKGKEDNRQILSLGGGQGIQGIQFASVGGLTYHLAKEKSLGRGLPTEWFLQTIRN
ncbi:MAG: ornithine cyclodeaminase family protein [Candidatus Binatia bacterium]